MLSARGVCQEEVFAQSCSHGSLLALEMRKAPLPWEPGLCCWAAALGRMGVCKAQCKSVPCPCPAVMLPFGFRSELHHESRCSAAAFPLAVTLQGAALSTLVLPLLHELCAPSSLCSSVVSLEVETWGDLWAVRVGVGPQSLCPWEGCAGLFPACGAGVWHGAASVGPAAALSHPAVLIFADVYGGSCSTRKKVEITFVEPITGHCPIPMGCEMPQMGLCCLQQPEVLLFLGTP